MNENVMASVHSVQSEAESLSYRHCFRKPDILGAGEHFQEKLALFHESKTNPASRDLVFVWSRTSCGPRALLAAGATAPAASRASEVPQLLAILSRCGDVRAPIAKQALPRKHELAEPWIEGHGRPTRTTEH